MAVDANIPLSGIAPPIMGPAQQLGLRDLAMQMQDAQRQRQIQQQVLQLNQMPGMRTPSGVPTDQYIMALSKISPQLADATVQHRSAILASESLAVHRKSEEDRERAKAGEEKRKEVLKGALSAYYSTPGSEEQKQMAFKKSISGSVEDLRKSGGGMQYGWDEAKLDHMGKTYPSIADAEGFVLPAKDVVERADTKAAAAVAGGDTMPLSQVGKPVAPQTQPPPGDPNDPNTPRPGERVYESMVTPEGMKTENIEVTARPPVDTVDSLREQAKAKEATAAKLRKLGTKAGNTQAKEAETQADKLRSASIALEQRNQKDTDQEIAAKREQRISAAKEGQDLRPEDAKRIAQQYIAGQSTAATGFARNQKNQSIIQRAITDEMNAQGKSAKEITAKIAEYHGLIAGENTLGRRSANIEMAVVEAQNMAPLVVTASKAVNRTQYPSLNAVILAAEKGTGDANVVKLGVAINSMVNIYARAINPQGQATVSDKDHARELLSAAWSHGQIEGGIQQLMLELEQARKAPGTVREEFRKAITNEPDKSGGYGKEKKKQEFTPEEIDAEMKRRGLK